METRKNRVKRIEHDDYKIDSGDSDTNDADDIRKSRIRDSNKEFAKRMTILQTWSQHWSDYTTREGEAYPQKEAKSIIKKAKKITCPIPTCRKSFTTVGGLRYHYARCNIERCFKCKVCNPPTEHKTRGDLLRHMVRSHYHQLPELDEEQKDIAHSYLSSSGRVDRSKNRRFHTDQETQLSCRTTVKLYQDLIESELASQNSEKRPFKDWRSLSRDWELLTYEIDRKRYYPPEKESALFKMTTESAWNTINAGDYTNLETDKKSSSKSMIFYTGGISTSSAWLPKPSYDKKLEDTSEVIAISVNCCSMERSFLYKDSKDVTGCIQFWTLLNVRSSTDLETEAAISFMIGHNYGIIFDMTWCPLASSWDPKPPKDGKTRDSSNVLSRMGLLALACGDGQIRIISAPHVDSLLSRSIIRHSDRPVETAPIYRVRPITTLMPPGVGPSTDYQTPACTALHWNPDDNQRLIAAGYSNGNVALFDLANYSPILYSTIEHRHIYQPLKSWLAHGLPVTGIAISSKKFERTLIVTGSRDKQVKIWNVMDLNSCLASDRAPITKLVWDYRLRGVVSATESAFTSFQNRVSYRYPTFDGYHAITVSTHRATVWGLANSIVTSSLATSDEAGEVFICPVGRPMQKRDKSHLNTHSLYTLLPRPLESEFGEAVRRDTIIQSVSQNGTMETTSSSLTFCVGTKDKEDGINSSVQIATIRDNDIIATGDEEVNDESQMVDDFGFVERPIANKPAKFLLPIDYPAVETYADFKRNFGLEFVNYETSIPQKRDQKLPKSCIRAADTANIYCDRVCDYPFCSIKHVSWSPNPASFQCLLSVSHIGLCRLDRVQVVEQVYKGFVETFCNPAHTKLAA